MISSRWLLVIAFLVFAPSLRAADRPPNIVLIYGDDVGYGDLGCYGATKVRTPNLDRLAKEGLRFTDGHSTSGTCTPSRYGMLTGQYPWRKAGTGILPGDAALIIPPGSVTLPSILQKAGYATGVVGKWHLGLGEGGAKIDWNTEIKPGPREIGFDYSFLIPATGDRVPCVYVENQRVAGLDPADPITVSYQQKVGDEPTGKERPDLLKMRLARGHDMTIVNGISRIGWMTGGKAARWVDEDMADTLTDKAAAFIEQHREKPFFLYFATHDIHVPRVPHARFAGKSGLGVRGDVIEELDWSVGRILETLARLKLDENTLVIFTGDNGPVLDDGYADEAVAKNGDHRAAGPLRGGKYSLYEAGTRVPFLARWSGRIPPGVSDALVCQLDFPATFAALAAQKLPAGAAPDSQNLLPALLGESKQGRAELVVHQGNAQVAFRSGTWKFIPPGQGGMGKKKAPDNPSPGELYDLATDLGETKNVAAASQELVAKLAARLAEIRATK